MQAKHAVVLTIDEMGEGGGETRYTYSPRNAVLTNVRYPE